QQQQAFARVIEAPYWVDAPARRMHQVHHRGPAFGIRDGGDISFGLVQQEINTALRTAQKFAVYLDVIARGIGLATKLRANLAVARDPALGDQLLGLAP